MNKTTLKVERLVRYKDLSSPEHPIPQNDAQRIMHIALPAGKNNVLLGSDIMERMGKVTENDNRNTISITAESRQEADKLFNGLFRLHPVGQFAHRHS